VHSIYVEITLTSAESVSQHSLAFLLGYNSLSWRQVYFVELTQQSISPIWNWRSTPTYCQLQSHVCKRQYHSTCQYFNYSGGNFDFFCHAGATCCTDGGCEMSHAGVDQSWPNFTPTGAGVASGPQKL